MAATEPESIVREFLYAWASREAATEYLRKAEDALERAHERVLALAAANGLPMLIRGFSGTIRRFDDDGAISYVVVPTTWAHEMMPIPPSASPTDEEIDEAALHAATEESGLLPLPSDQHITAFLRDGGPG